MAPSTRSLGTDRSDMPSANIKAPADILSDATDDMMRARQQHEDAVRAFEQRTVMGAFCVSGID